MKKKFHIFFFLAPAIVFAQPKLIDLVNPFIGTGGHGHTFPGSTLPFGMVQLSPDTRLQGWDGCSGYHYSDSIIYGFSHTHLSGTGVGDYCDLLFMPTQGDVEFENGYKSGSSNGYSSFFKKDSEQASPGYYQVYLEENNIDVRLTTTARVGIHEYTFGHKEVSNLIIDLEHRDPLLTWSLKQLSKNEIVGHRVSRSWAEEQHFYFVLQTSQPIDMVETSVGEMYKNKGGDPTKMALRYKRLKGNRLLVKVGISSVSIEGARKNLLNEAEHWNFNQYKSLAQETWEKALNKIQIKGGLKEERIIFYTALYHSMIAPNLFSDVDGKYRGTDLKVYSDFGSRVYTVFSLWDTFRAAHPLYTIIEQEKTKEFIATFIKHYLHGGQLPVWELSANYTGCMIGYHVVSVVLDALVKGIEIDDQETLFKAMLQLAERDQLGIFEYIKHGYIPSESETESVSKTLEYAYNDWCIASMAERIDKPDYYNIYIKRAQYYKNLFNSSSGFMQPKINGGWQFGFKPEEVNFNFTEANSWQYSMFVPQDIQGLIKLHGGKDKFETKLDQLFESSSELSGRHQSDITGMIGQYAHGNEPSHHMAYLYNYIGKPYKTQFRVAQILKDQYTTLPDGLSGNEDCGQMSSWYVLSAMGFYSVTPGMPYYTIGIPIFDQLTIQLENGNKFNISVNKEDIDDGYIQKVTLNNKVYNASYLSHEDIVKGGDLIFELGKEPNFDWGVGEIPFSAIDAQYQITAVPFFNTTKQSFVDSLKLELKSVDDNAVIYYKEKKSTDFKVFKKSFYIYSNCEFQAFSLLNGKKSKMVVSSYKKMDDRRNLILKNKYDNQYNAGGDKALIDGLKGKSNFKTGYWQGFQELDFSAVLDLGSSSKISYISIGALQDIKSWIWFPKEVSFYTSNDDEHYNKIVTLKNDFSHEQYGSYIKEFDKRLSNPIKCRYIKIEASNFGACPDWHLGKGGKTWLFFDEIVVE